MLGCFLKCSCIEKRMKINYMPSNTKKPKVSMPIQTVTMLNTTKFVSQLFFHIRMNASNPDANEIEIIEM
jgi:hypothetical protein